MPGCAPFFSRHTDESLQCHASSLSRVIPGHVIFFFIATPTTVIYTLSLHDALPIFGAEPIARGGREGRGPRAARRARRVPALEDRKSTRLNSSHQIISYAVFCLKKKKESVTMSRREVIRAGVGGRMEKRFRRRAAGW